MHISLKALELSKDTQLAKSMTPYKGESLSNKRYIMITNQKSSIQQLNEPTNLPINQGSVPINTDQSPINFLLFQS